MKLFVHSVNRILLDVANKWLQHSFDWEVVNCESVTLLFRHNACSHVSQWDLMPNVAATQVMGQEAAIKALRYDTDRQTHTHTLPIDAVITCLALHAIID